MTLSMNRLILSNSSLDRVGNMITNRGCLTLSQFSWPESQDNSLEIGNEITIIGYNLLEKISARIEWESFDLYE